MIQTSTIVLFQVGILIIMIRQEFDIGDLVKLVGPIGAAGEVGLVTANNRIQELPERSDYHWHRDEYRCLVKLTTGECEWVRAKFLRIISRAGVL
jgi:hypothetical protein